MCQLQASRHATPVTAGMGAPHAGYSMGLGHQEAVMQERTITQVHVADLARELADVEDEVCALSIEPSLPGVNSRLLELASREYEILAALSRPWKPWPETGTTFEAHE